MNIHNLKVQLTNELFSDILQHVCDKHPRPEMCRFGLGVQLTSPAIKIKPCNAESWKHIIIYISIIIIGVISTY